MIHRAVYPSAAHRIFYQGDPCTSAQAGDFILTRHPGFIAKGIRFFQRIRKPLGLTWRQWWDFCGWNHAAPILGSGATAMILQETAGGVVITPLAKLEAEAFALISVQTSAPQLAAAVDFAHSTSGTGYGWFSIFADVFNAATGLELSLGWGNKMVCSTQTCRFLERMGLIPDRSPYAVVPAHLALYLNVPYAPRSSI